MYCANLSGADLSFTNCGGYAIVASAEEGGGYYYIPGTNFTGANLTSANLANAYLSGPQDYEFGYYHPGANFTNANLTGADARAANLLYATMTGAVTTNLIHPNGHLAGLDLTRREYAARP